MKIRTLTLNLYNRQRINNNTRFCAGKNDDADSDGKFFVELITPESNLSELKRWQRNLITNNVAYVGFDFDAKSLEEHKRNLSLTPDQQRLVEENLWLVDFVMSPKFYTKKTNDPKGNNMKRAIGNIIAQSTPNERKLLASAGWLGLCQAALNSKKIDSETLFSTYAVSCIANAIIGEVRRKSFRLPIPPREKIEQHYRTGTDLHEGDDLLSLNEFNKELGERLYQVIIDPKVQDPSEVAILREQWNIVQNAIKQLSDENQNILKMRMSGESYENIAAVVDLPINTLRVRLYRIINKIIAKVEPAKLYQVGNVNKIKNSQTLESPNVIEDDEQ